MFQRESYILNEFNKLTGSHLEPLTKRSTLESWHITAVDLDGLEQKKNKSQPTVFCASETSGVIIKIQAMVFFFVF